MLDYAIIDTDNKKQQPFSDLVSNSKIFKKEYKTEDLLKLKDVWTDNSDYSDYPTLDTVIKNYNPVEDKHKSFVCRVQDKYVWSSCGKIGGYDRPNDVDYKKCHSHLNEKVNGNGQKKGFNDDDADVLHGKIRFIKKNGKYSLYLVKNRGNHRFVMKKLANNGEPTEHLFKIKFHDILDNKLNEDYFKMDEGDGHHTDAQLRTSQNEPQKFTSGLVARKKHFVDLFNFLKENKINYKGVMEIHNVECDEWLTISSVQLLNGGISNGAFSMYGKENIEYAIKTIQRSKDTTKETKIFNSAVLSIASVYQSFTKDQTKSTVPSSQKDESTATVAFDKKELDDFFDLYIEESHGKSLFSKKPFKFNSLTITKNIKCREHIFLEKLFVSLEAYHRNLRGRKNRYLTVRQHNVEHFLAKITDPLLKEQSYNTINNTK